VKKIKGVIFDIDGVLEFQGSVYPGAIETVDALRGRGIALRFLTNSTLKSRASCTAKLREAGFQVFYEQVITASYATAVYLGKLKPRSCWIMLEREGLDEFRDFYQDTENPEYIVVGDNRSRFDFEHMNKALRLLLGGAKLIGMIPELVDTSMGEAELNVGSWVGMLERASGVKATYVGKPNAHVFELALRSMGLGKDEVVMVGDRVSTDIKGAKDFGMRAVLLRTGEFEGPDLASGVEPDFVFDSIQEVLSVFEPSGTGRAEETGSCRGQGEWRRKGL
jgi:HAD superfamily hydrolase (TIGR01458 family)